MCTPQGGCNTLQCVAVCCNTLQCVAVCCSVLQCVHRKERLLAVWCNVSLLQCEFVAMCPRARIQRYFAEYCLFYRALLQKRPIILSILPTMCPEIRELHESRDSRVATIFIPHVCCSVLQCVAVCCSVLQCVAVCCNALQCVVERFASCDYLDFRCMLQCVALWCSALQCVVQRFVSCDDLDSRRRLFLFLFLVLPDRSEHVRCDTGWLWLVGSKKL